ncbi:MAG: DNA mismatch repair protein MutS [Oscillospiraceae bacterium]|nr:DNA mismatch repair protein MutS [Oscillospiraceae bacterium]
MDENKKTTPMMEQYLEIKAAHKEYVLFYRLGDFYEMFFEDAENVSKELDIVLTSRGDVPMCGVPHHSAETYINRLIKKGYKVALCEQIDVPKNSKGLVKRAVRRIVTAGTVIEDSMLDEQSNNFIACFFAERQSGDVKANWAEGCGFVFADLSTGEIHLFEKRGKGMQNAIMTELARYHPVEILFNREFMSYSEISHFIKEKIRGCTGDVLDDSAFESLNFGVVCEQFKLGKEEDFENVDMKLAVKALLALLRYFADTQNSIASRFTNITFHNEQEYMSLNLTTIRNLELTETMRNKERCGSLIWVLDKTNTSMGKRKLKQYIERPLNNHLEIIKRLDVVEFLTKNITVLGDLCGEFSGIGDIERLMTRIVYKAASPRDVYAIGKAAFKMPEIKTILTQSKTPVLLSELNESISHLDEVSSLVEKALMPEPPSSLKDGGVINHGYNSELDKLREMATNSKEILSKLEERERAKTGIKNLKVGYNRVFGYYIEVSKGNVSSVPTDYVRRQTLTNGERYITDELKKIEDDILWAKDKSLALENQIFSQITDFLSEKLVEIQATAAAISEIDVLSSFANVALANGYCRPDITLESVIEIREGRHPVVEKMLKDGVFIPNDAYLDVKENRLLVITGPNMAGKSTYMRQVAIITLMAHLGSFIPATCARIGVVDKIFTRVGASDDLTAGQSTFMVEMNEVAEVLENATSKSLVILDEIGRGTSTFDGISIAKAVAEYINSSQIGCKTMFATHYHELIGLEHTNQGIRNYSVLVSKKGDEIKFLHKIAKGGADDSYGVEVAKLAGLPKKVINNAKATLKTMEHNSKIELENELREREQSEPQIDFSTLAKESALNTLKNIDINNLTPDEALKRLVELKKTLDGS